jgi:ribose transport system ATP-binding protein
MTPQPLRIEELTVDYGAHRAVDRVALTFAPGSVHALLGANGSGKSSLLKALAGVSQGRVRLRLDAGPDRAKLTRLSTATSRELGLRFVHQDLGLIEDLPVLDNLFLTNRPPSRLGQVRWRRTAAQARAALDAVGLATRPQETVATLRPSARVLIAVARALMDLPQAGGFVFLDEPTAGLDERESQELLTRVRDLAGRGDVGIVLVTHRLREVERYADDVTVLRDGRIVLQTTRSAGIDVSEIVTAMSGAPAARADVAPAPARVPGGAPQLELAALSGRDLVDVTLAVGRGEIVGFTGLEGSGKEELVDLLYGVSRPSGGTVRLDGQPVVCATPAHAVRQGIALVPADRVGAGGIAELQVQDNLLLPSLREFVRGGAFRRAQARAATDEALERYQVEPPVPDLAFGSLSGGNQQKVIVGRWLRRETRLLLLHEPTAGVDVAARELLWSGMREAAARGVAVVVVTSDVSEAAALCDRVAVLVDGRLSAVLAGEERTADRILAASLVQGGTAQLSRTDQREAPPS